MYKIVQRFSLIIAPLIFSLIFLGVPIPSFAQEQLTITTYYPSPAGRFSSLTVTGLLTAGQLHVTGTSQLDGAVTAGSNISAAGNISATNVSASSRVSAPTVNATTVNATNVNASGTVSAGYITAPSGYIGTLTSGNITTTNIAATNAVAGTVNAGTVNAVNMNAVGINAVSVNAVALSGIATTGVIIDGLPGPVLSSAIWLSILAACVVCCLICWSSIRYKENVKPLGNGLEKIMKLRGVTFDWKASKKHDIGFIAEELGEVFPELLAYEEDGKTVRGFRPEGILAALVEAVKTQQKQIEQLNEEVGVLKKALATHR